MVMGSIAENLKEINEKLPDEVTLVAVSKTKPGALLMEAYKEGQRIFGENKVQELVEKYEHLPKDIQWHFIGHLQTNKVKYLAPFVSLIHGVDSVKLLKAINKEGKKCHRRIPCLLQIHIAKESTKFGLSFEEVEAVVEQKVLEGLENVSVVGLMGMATNTSDLEVVRNEFHSLKSLFDQLNAGYFKDCDNFSVLSMGMSGDFSIAIEEGSSMVRVGSSIFGARNYSNKKQIV